MDPIILNPSQTLLVACFALLIGMLVVNISSFLKKNHIPEAVVGGFIVAIMLFGVNKMLGYSFAFNKDLQRIMMLAFFTSIGLSSDFKRLLRGGLPLVILLILVTILIFLQNVVGISIAVLLGENPFLGLLTGSIALTGGHGTAGAWGKVIEENYNYVGAESLGLAAATLGLIIGGLLGGPVARHLLKKVTLPTSTEETKDEVKEQFEFPKVKRKINANNILQTVSMLIISITIGGYITELTNDTWIQMPHFVWSLMVGILIRNMLSIIFKHEVYEPTVDVLGSVALSLFLAMALIELNFNQLAGLAGPILIILAVQIVLMTLFAIFVTFRFMGRDYDAAVITAGHCGFGMGATPTAIANMQTITRTYGPSHKAFLLVPLVGAFIVDISNTIMIKFGIYIASAIS